jgi:hypothetical protein
MDTWIYLTMIVLSIIVMVSAVGTIILVVLHQPMSELLIMLGVITAVGLVRLVVPSLLI